MTAFAADARAEEQSFFCQYRNPVLLLGRHTDNSPLLEHPKHGWENHVRNQVNEDTVKDWVAFSDDPMALIDTYKQVGIIKDLDVECDIPIVKVGPTFFRLSALDKHYLASAIDQAFLVTKRADAGLFMFRDPKTHQTVGIYTVDGLQLQ